MGLSLRAIKLKILAVLEKKKSFGFYLISNFRFFFSKQLGSMRIWIGVGDWDMIGFILKKIEQGRRLIVKN